MNRQVRHWLFCIGVFLGSVWHLQAQLTVYPGDANDNGIVNNIDVLYVGYSFGTPGPSRVLTDTDFEPQESPLAWSSFFPDGTSYAYADANGDGIVGSRDLLTIYQNYGATHPPVIPDVFPEPTEGAARLYLQAENQPFPIVPGSELFIPIYLNDTDHPVELNGLAFSLEYDDQYVKEIRLDWRTNWFNADSSWYGLQVPTLSDRAQLDIAATRFGNDPVRGGGIVGWVSIIIEDDLIELMPTPEDTLVLNLDLVKLRAIGKDFTPILLEGADHEITIHHPDVDPNPSKDPQNPQFIVYPNPVQEELRLEARKVIQKIVLYDLLGRPLLMESNLDSAKIQLPVTNLPPGLYLILVQTEEGISSREILIE